MTGLYNHLPISITIVWAIYPMYLHFELLVMHLHVHVHSRYFTCAFLHLSSWCIIINNYRGLSRGLEPIDPFSFHEFLCAYGSMLRVVVLPQTMGFWELAAYKRNQPGAKHFLIKWGLHDPIKNYDLGCTSCTYSSPCHHLNKIRWFKLEFRQSSVLSSWKEFMEEEVTCSIPKVLLNTLDCLNLHCRTL